MNSNAIRRTFLDYFAARGHRVVPGSPLVLPRDPTLLFANAGMNQFKDVFTGRERRDYARAATVQRCLRVSGKHNDLETVGRTPRHHTFFEMLGNFSFGDYFKREAIGFAWELVTREFGLAPERLWISVFGGTPGIPADEAAWHLWRDEIGVPEERILRLGEADNFWRMGDTGPCGPCSEIYYDFGAAPEDDPRATPATDERRFLEIWNLVFMQFDAQPDGTLLALPAPSIDTGMGLERVACVLQGKRSNYDTDLFVPLCAAAAARAGVRYGDDPAHDVSLRVIADHARAFCVMVADGVVPANDRRGYVLRRLLRRAIRHGRKLGIGEPFLHEVTPVVIELLGPTYPELVAAKDAVLDLGRREERRFAETLSAGLALLEQQLAAATAGPGAPAVLPGHELFRLHDTFGFPLDLARDVAEERGVALDEAGFEVEMRRQRERAQASWKQGHREPAGAGLERLAGRLRTRFEGYGQTRLDGVRVAALFHAGAPAEALEAGQEGELVLEATPFYAEAGGQVGDTGLVAAASGRSTVLDTQRPLDGLIVHRVRVEAGSLVVGEPVLAEVDRARRDAVRRNHTATHLLHAALRETVGPHVKQAGSLVAPERLRFDFSHFAPLGETAVSEIEALINERVLADVAVETEEQELERALASGAMALFGEKYGERVRVVRIGDFSLELCGGTHCARTGEVGLVKLTQERGIASGTRRVEALSGDRALARFRDDQALVQAFESQLGVPRERLVEELERRGAERRELERELERLRREALGQRLAERLARVREVAGVRVLAERVDGVAAAELRELADGLRQKLRSGVVILGRAEEGKASLLVAVTDDLKTQLPAGDLVRVAARVIGGGGGGRADFAEAGGRDAARLDQALEAAVGAVAARMGAG